MKRPPPGRRAVFSRKIGDYDAIAHRLSKITPKISVETRTGRRAPLTAFNTDAAHDFGAGILRSWATIGDILSFYQARIGDEGYLASARDPQSLRLFAQMTGYTPGFARPAATYLAYIVGQNRKDPEYVEIPAGPATQVLSIPSDGGGPATFENAQALQAREVWNSVDVVRPTESTPQTLSNGALSVQVVGGVASIHVGANIVLRLADHCFLRKVSKLERKTKEGWTRLWWTDPLVLPTASAVVVDAIYSFKQSVELFGARASDWASAPDAQKARFGEYEGGVLSLKPKQDAAVHAVISGLPYTDVRALETAHGHVFAATSAGIYRLSAGDWTKCPTQPPNFSTYALHLSVNGDLLAGGPRGALISSSDNGYSWRSISNEMVIDQGKGPIRRMLSGVLSVLANIIGSLRPSLKKALKPNPKQRQKTGDQPQIRGVIKAIASGKDGTDTFVFVGTDQGVFRKFETDTHWTPFGKGLPGYNGKTGLASTQINDLTVIEASHGSAGYLLAATEHGIFGSDVDGDELSQLTINDAKPHLATYCIAAANGVAYVGAADGLYAYSKDEGWRKEAIEGLGDGRVTMASADPFSSASEDAENAEVIISGKGGLFGLGDSWFPLNLRRRRVFAAPDVYSSGLDSEAITPALKDLFSAKKFDLPAGATVKKSERPGHWRIFDPDERLAIYHLKSQDGSLIVSSVAPLDKSTITSGAFTPQGNFLTASEPKGFFDPDWPGLEIETDIIALNRTVQGVAPGSMVAIVSDRLTGLYQVGQVDNRPIDQFSKRGVVTTTAIEPDDMLGLFSLRDAKVLVQSAALTPFAPETATTPTLSGSEITADIKAEGLTAGKFAAITGRPATAVLPATGGFGPANSETPQHGLGLDVSVLAPVKNGMAVGTADGLVLLATKAFDAPDKWLCCLDLKQEITGLAAYQGALFAASAKGMFVWRGDRCFDVSGGLDGACVRQVLTGPGGKLFAVVKDKGIFQFADSSGSWAPYASLSNGAEIRQIAFDAAGDLFGASNLGLLTLVEGVLTPSTKPDEAFDAYSLVISGDQDIFIGAKGEVLARRKNTWRRLGAPIGSTVASALAIDPAGGLWVGGRGFAPKIFSKDIGWTASAASPANDVTALCCADDMIVAGYGARTWFTSPDGRQIAKVDSLIARGPSSLVNGVSSGVVPPALNSLMQNSGIKLTDNAAIAAGMRPGEWILRDDTAAYRLLEQPSIGDLAILSTPLLTPRSDDDLVTVSDGADYLSVEQSFLTFGPSRSDAKTVSEIIEIQDSSQTASGANITLASPMTLIFDYSDAKICLNVALATEGQTLSGEPLSPISADNRRYAVSRGPVLTDSTDDQSSILAAVGATGGARLSLAGPVSASNSVTVDWKQVAALRSQKPDAYVYATTPTDQGALVTFGDGVNGARLPEGAEVSATWRIRTSPKAANVEPDAIRMFRVRPPGVKSASNPTAATGGVDPPSLASIRENIVKNLKADRRLIGLSDYSTAAMSYPGVLSALAMVDKEAAEQICLSISDDPNNPVNLVALKSALNRKRAMRAELTVERAQTVGFCIKVSITAMKGVMAEQAGANAYSALRSRFERSGAQVGQAVDIEMIKRTAQSAAGVAEAQVEQLYFEFQTPHLAKSLTARGPKWLPQHNKWFGGEYLRLSLPFDVELSEGASND